MRKFCLHRHLLFKRGIGLLLSVLLLFLILITSRSSPSNLSEDIPTYLQKVQFPNISSDHQIGVTESILNDEPDNSISIHYPVLGLEKIDACIEKHIKTLIQNYQEERQEALEPDKTLSSSLWVDYCSYTAGNRYASIVFEVTKSFSNTAHPDEFIITYNFDLQTQQLLTMDDVFQGEYLLFFCDYTRSYFSLMEQYKKYIEEESYQLGSAPIPGNYQDFALISDGIRLYFKKYQLFPGSEGVTSIRIPYQLLVNYLAIVSPSGSMPQSQPVSASQTVVPAVNPTPIDKTKPMIALTFDDGPHGKVTPMILDILKQNDAKATFFVVGNRVDSYASILQREYAEGHEIGNHTYNHPSLAKLQKEEMRFQTQETDQKINNIISFTPKLLRPPYGSINNVMKACLDKPFILWSVDSQDWKTQNKSAIVSEVLNNVKDGDVILMHDLYPTTAQACQELIPKLKEQGFQLVTVSELLEEKEIVPVAGSVYHLAS